MRRIKDFKIGKKVRWYYQISKWSKAIDEIVYIGSDISETGRIRIDRKDKNELIEGGYVNTDELYEPN